MNIEQAEAICDLINKESEIGELNFDCIDGAGHICWKYLFLQPNICDWMNLPDPTECSGMGQIYLLAGDSLRDYLRFLKKAVYTAHEAEKEIRDIIHSNLGGHGDAVTCIIDQMNNYPTNASFLELGLYFAGIGEFVQSVSLLQKASDGYGQELGDNNGKTLISMMNLGTALSCSGDSTSSVSVLQKALKGMEKTFGQDDEETLYCAMSLAMSLQKTDQLSEAVTILKAKEKLSSYAGDIIGYTLACYHNLTGNEAEAKRLIARQVAIDPSQKQRALSDDDLIGIHQWVESNF